MYVMYFILLILFKFRTKLWSTYNLIIWESTKFDTEQKSSKFLFEIVTLVSSANNTGHNVELFLRGRSFMYIMKNRALELILGELYVSMSPSQRKTF